MMTAQLKNTIVFTNVAPGATVALPHGLVITTNEVTPLVPDIVALCQTVPANTPFSVSLSNDMLNVVVTNNGNVAASVTAYVEAWHTIERCFGSISTTASPQFTRLSVQPVFINGTGSAANTAVCVLEAAVNQVIPTGVITTMVLPTVLASSPISMTAGPANTITIPFDGIYTIRGNARFGLPIIKTGERAGGVRVSGAALLCETRVDSFGNDLIDCIGTTMLPLTAGTILEGYAFQSSGNDVNLVVDTPAPVLRSRLEVSLVVRS
jgi:hypothetical protein